MPYGQLMVFYFHLSRVAPLGNRRLDQHVEENAPLQTTYQLLQTHLNHIFKTHTNTCDAM